MGYMRHHAIVVTSFDNKLIDEAHVRAKEVFPFITDITPESVNGYSSFFIPPDGSKEGWTESTTGDNNRAIFINWLHSKRHEDNSTSLAWFEVQYGDCNHETKVTNDGDSFIRNET